MLDVLVKMAMVKCGLPVLGDEYTLKNVDGADRVDATASRMIEAKANENPLTAAMFSAMRPYVDGILTAQVGPQRLEQKFKALKGRAQSGQVVRKSKPRKAKECTALVVRGKKR